MYQILPGHVRMRAEVRSSQVSPSGLKGKGDPTQTWSPGLPGTKKGVVGDCLALMGKYIKKYNFLTCCAKCLIIFLNLKKKFDTKIIILEFIIFKIYLYCI